MTTRIQMPPAAPPRRQNICIRRSSFLIRHLRASAVPAFTLVEMVIALTIVVLLGAATVAMIQGFRDERLAREPVAELVRLAKEARMRAMREKRPYQVAFHAAGFTASRYFNPYLQRSELTQFLESAQTLIEQPDFDKTDIDSGGGPTNTTELPLAPPRPKLDEHWSESYDAPPDMKFAIQFWYEDELLYLEGDTVKLWVFQPSGVCVPLTVHIERQSATFDVEFAALTADIVREKIDLR